MELYLHFSLIMVRSPGFGSITTNFIALFRLALASAPNLLALSLACYDNSPDHSTKGTISHFDVLYVLVSTAFQVLFTPLPGSFSPFLHSTILYRSLGSILAWRVVSPSSHGISRVPQYSGYALQYLTHSTRLSRPLAHLPR